MITLRIRVIKAGPVLKNIKLEDEVRSTLDRCHADVTAGVARSYAAAGTAPAWLLPSPTVDACGPERSQASRSALIVSA
jgi:hypothetical protein